MATVREQLHIRLSGLIHAPEFDHVCFNDNCRNSKEPLEFVIADVTRLFTNVDTDLVLKYVQCDGDRYLSFSSLHYLFYPMPIATLSIGIESSSNNIWTALHME